MDRIVHAGEFLNFSQQRSIIDQTNLQINRLERYKDFDQMDEVGEITLALDMYADEASLIDPEEKHSVMCKSPERTVKEAVEDFLYNTLMVDHWLRPWIRYLCKYGDLGLEVITTKDRTGVASLRPMNVYNFTRVETKWGDLIGFFYQEQLTGGGPEFFHPWQVVHARLLSLETIYKPYGRAILDGARKHFKQLRLMEDAALIYRITRAPMKRVFTIPVGNMPAHEISGYMVDIARSFKKRQFFDPATNDVNERWHPLIQEDDYWLPKRVDGEQPTIDTLPGAENLDQIADIEYFKKKMVAALKIPFSRVGIGEGQEADSKPLSQTAPEFAKAVQWIQREVALCLKKVVIIHLILQGFNTEQLKNFDLFMTASSAIDALYRMEVWQTRADVIESLKSTDMFSDAWILQHFTPLTDEEIEEMEEDRRLSMELQQLMGGGMGGGMGMGGMGGGMGGMGGAGMGMPPDMGGGMPGDMGGGPPPAGGAPLMADKDSAENLISEEKHVRFGYQRRILEEEVRIQEKKILIEGRLKEIRDNRRKRFIAREAKFSKNSGYSYMLDHDEFNGIKSGGGELLVEHGTPMEDIQEIITETLSVISPDHKDKFDYSVFTEAGVEAGQVINESAPSEITEEDLPPPIEE